MDKKTISKKRKAYILGMRCMMWLSIGITVALVLFILIVAISCFPKDFEKGIRESINKALKKDEDEDE